MATIMDDDNSLVVEPFQYIVAKGKEALRNAGDSQPMAKAAESLIKEGERALRRIEPLCKKYLAEFGANFRNAVRENDEITEYRLQLTDLTWGFEDFTESPDCFDAEEFAKLQALSRKIAPKIYDILMRLKLEAPYDDLSPSGSQSSMKRLSSTGCSQAGFPPSSPHRTTCSEGYTPSLSPQFVPLHRASLPTPSEPRPDADDFTIDEHLKNAMGQEDGFDEEPDPELSQMPHKPLQAPTMDHWYVNMPPPSDETNPIGDNPRERRAEVIGREGAESPVDPTYLLAFPTTPGQQDISAQRTTPDHGTNYSGPVVNEGEDRFHLSSNRIVNPSPRVTNLDKPCSPSPNQPHDMYDTPGMANYIPADSATGGTGGTLAIAHSQTTPISSKDHVTSSSSSPIPTTARYVTGANFAGSTDHRLNYTCDHARHTTSETIPSSELSMSPGTKPMAYEGKEVAPHHYIIDQEAPIPVASETAHVSLKPEMAKTSSLSSSINCSITPQSSFWKANGFCGGAKEVIKGGIGVKKTKKPVGLTAFSTIAKCTHCDCELDFKDIENDVNKLEAGTYSRGSISYRIRFLQKSHIAAKRVDDVQYGCLFCVQQGHTLDTSDATVFFSPRALMDHIARHPRPLPDVPGLVVIDGPEVPAHLANDFDVQLKQSPVPHPVIKVRSEIINLPTATAKEQARRLYGQILLFDRTPALDLAVGARITGLTWPAKYEGQWAFGWHDGIHASVPTEILRLDTPPNHDIKKGDLSKIRARVRWRFNPGKEKDSKWLKLEKNDVITNIAWSYFDHWCWSGTNPKGKWGIFPQAFLDTNTLEQPTGSSRAMSLSEEMNRSLSFMGRFGRRSSGSNTRQQGMRPSSVAGSTSSHESRSAHHMARGSYGDIHAT